MKNTKLSVLFRGRWSYAVPTNKIKEEGGVSFYKINRKFGIVRRSERNPAAHSKVGVAGDYLTIDISGDYGIMKKKIFDAFFPSQKTTPSPAPILSSQALEDPKFLTNIVEKYRSSDSNSTQDTGGAPVRAPKIRKTNSGGSRY